MFLVLGSGSVGSLIGGLLTREGYNVFMIGRAPHITITGGNGLKIQGLIEKQVEPINAGTFDYIYPIVEMLNDEINYIIITTKAHQTRQAAEEIMPIVCKHTTIVSIQNGIGTEEILQELYPDNLVLRGVTSIGVSRPKPGVVDYSGRGKTLIGYTTDAEKEKANLLVQALNKSGLETELESNIQGAVFTKTIVNCALNPLTAIHQVKNAEIYKQKVLRNKATTLAKEAWTVTKKLGIKLPVEDPVKYAMDVIKKTGENTNSMLSDVRNKKKTEIDFITGKIVSFADELEIEVPHNKEVYKEILAIEQSYTEL
ncbi:MAG: ketopantoate reductase family protein [Candidatus Heimdallarchaeota archaeon]